MGGFDRSIRANLGFICILLLEGMNKQFIVGKERDSAKRFRIFRQGSRREIDLDL